jgi:hypothetical protein
MSRILNKFNKAIVPLLMVASSLAVLPACVSLKSGNHVTVGAVPEI